MSDTNKEDKFYIENDALYRQVHVYKDIYTDILVITKDAFVECYKKWILGESEESDG